MSKGQIQHAFIFILFIVIAGFLAILGYKAITGLMGGGCELERTTFQDKIVNMFDRYDDYGSLHREKVKLPCDYRQVCFVDSSVYNSTSWFPAAPLSPEKLPVIATAKDTRVNIFIIGDFAEPAGYSEKIIVDDPTNITCVQARGRYVDLVFRGKGQKTLVEEE